VWGNSKELHSLANAYILGSPGTWWSLLGKEAAELSRIMGVSIQKENISEETLGKFEYRTDTRNCYREDVLEGLFMSKHWSKQEHYTAQQKQQN
jgi:hypothetical protein